MSESVRQASRGDGSERGDTLTGAASEAMNEPPTHFEADPAQRTTTLRHHHCSPFINGDSAIICLSALFVASSVVFSNYLSCLLFLCKLGMARYVCEFYLYLSDCVAVN